MKKLIFAITLSVLPTAQASIQTALAELKNDLTPETYTRVATQCAQLQAAIHLAPSHLHQSLTSTLEKKLSTIHRTHEDIETGLKEFIRTTLAPSVEEYQEHEGANTVDERHLQPIYRTLGVLGCCALIYLCVSYLRNHRAAKFLRNKGWPRPLAHDTTMVSASEELTAIVGRGR